MFEHTHSLGWVGAAGLARFVPALLLGAYGGVVAERFERVRVMVGVGPVCALLQACWRWRPLADGPPGAGIVLAGLSAIANRRTSRRSRR